MLLSLVKVWILVTSVSAIRILEICPKNSPSTGICDVNKWKVELPSGCFRSFHRQNHGQVARMLCGIYGGSFTLETIPYIAPHIDCISKIGKSYFINAILEKGIWTTLDGSKHLNFTNFMEFNPMDCDEGSVLVWYPHKNKINPLGKLKCKKDTTKTRSMCFLSKVNGNWGGWTDSSTCNVTCGSGTKNQTRSCNNPAPANGGSPCLGLANQTVTCNTNLCPVNGSWGGWKDSSDCTSQCGTGKKNQTRSCNNPPPSNGGSTCLGSANQAVNCNSNSNCSGRILPSHLSPLVAEIRRVGDYIKEEEPKPETVQEESGFFSSNEKSNDDDEDLEKSGDEEDDEENVSMKVLPGKPEVIDKAKKIEEHGLRTMMIKMKKINEAKRQIRNEQEKAKNKGLQGYIM